MQKPKTVFKKIGRYFCTSCGYHHNKGANRFDEHLQYGELPHDDDDNPKDISEFSDILDGDLEESTEQQNNTSSQETLSRNEIENGIYDDSPKLEDIEGVSEKLARQLKALGLYTPGDLAGMEKEKLVELLHAADWKGVGKKTAKKLINRAKDASGNVYITAMDMNRKRKIRIQQSNLITTGSNELDALFGGGWTLDSSYELYGQGAMGKSELALQLCVNAYLPHDRGGINREGFDFDILWIDTEGVMKHAVSRLPTMARKAGETFGWEDAKIDDFINSILPKIVIKQAFSSRMQQAHAENQYQAVLDGEKNCAIVIVDSLVNNFRVDYPDLNNLAPRQRAINRHISALKDIVAISNIPNDLTGILVCTNQAQHAPTFFGDGLKNIGGNVVQQNLDNRFAIRKSKGNLRKVQLVDSSSLPTGKQLFSINDWGIGSENGSSSLEKFV